MKFTKKKVLVIALAVCLAAVISMGSLAWFTDEDSVTNDFYVGDSNTPADKVFGIDVWETVDGKEIGKGDTTENGYVYETILPGEKFSKAPVLENTGIHPQFVRAIVTVSGADILVEAMGDNYWKEADLFFPGMGDNWTLENVLYLTTGELAYVYYYDVELAAGAVTDVLFEEVVIPTALTKEQAAVLDNFSVKVLGQAIQSEHILVDNAKDAFVKYWDAEGTIAGFPFDQIIPVVVKNAAELNDALAGGAVSILLDDTADWSAAVTVSADAKDVTIDANGTAAALAFAGTYDNVVLTNIVDFDGKGGITVNYTNAKGNMTITDSTFYSENGTGGAAIRAGKEIDLTFDNCDFVQGASATSKSYGVYGYGSADLTFTKCTFADFASWAVQINGTTFGDVLIDNCEYNNCSAGIFKTSVGGSGNGLLNGNFTFTNNVLTNCGGHTATNFFSVKTAEVITIEGNVMDGADFVVNSTNYAQYGITQIARP